jgi:hypothetical protein
MRIAMAGMIGQLRDTGGVPPWLTSPKGAGRHEVAVPSDARDGAQPHTFPGRSLRNLNEAFGILSQLFTVGCLEFDPYPPSLQGDVMDLLYIALAFGFFAATAALVPLFEKLRKR